MVQSGHTAQYKTRQMIFGCLGRNIYLPIYLTYLSCKLVALYLATDQHIPITYTLVKAFVKTGTKSSSTLLTYTEIV